MALTDIASRTYDHRWRLDPIVRSLLDTYFYKLLMLQMIWRQHGQVDVTFSLINRTARKPERRCRKWSPAWRAQRRSAGCLSDRPRSAAFTMASCSRVAAMASRLSLVPAETFRDPRTRVYAYALLPSLVLALALGEIPDYTYIIRI